MSTDAEVDEFVAEYISNEKALREKRVKFNETLRDSNYYPNAASPGDCYIFDVVLGIDPRTVVAGTITQKKYKVWYPVTGGKPNERITVTREFDQKQRYLLKEWWELLSEEIR